MKNIGEEHLTVVQHLLQARVKLVTVHARLLQFGEKAGEDPKSIERVEIAMQHIEAARHALSAAEESPPAEPDAVPF